MFKHYFLILAFMLSTCSLYSSTPQDKAADLKYAKEQGWIIELPSAQILKAALEQQFCDFVVKTKIHETLANQELLPISVAVQCEFAFLEYSKKTPDQRMVTLLSRRKAEIVEIIENHSTKAKKMDT